MHRPASTVVLILGFAFGLTAGAVESADTPLARWTGGELSRETFRADFDSSGQLLRAGGMELRTAILSASVVEIFSQEALKLHLDENPELIQRISKWSRRRLAALYREYEEPDPKAKITGTAMRAYYEKHREDLFKNPATADFEMLFIRCGTEEKERTSCRKKMAGFRRKAQDSGDLQALIETEEARSGKANGVFSDIPLKSLSPELANALRKTPPGEIGDVVETPIGLFLPRLLHLRPSSFIPFEKLSERIRADFSAEARRRWRDARRTELLQAGFRGENDEALFAEAARSEHFDRDPGFLKSLRRTRKRELALAALVRDSAFMPSNGELRSRIEKDPGFLESHKNRHLLIAYIDAAKDRYEAFRTVDRVKKILDSTSDTARTFRDLPEKVPGLRLEDPGFIDMRQIEKLHPNFPAIVTKLKDGQYQGPILLSPSLQRVTVNSEGLASRDQLPTGFAFLFLEKSITPPFELIRDELLRSAATEILKAPEKVEEKLKTIWKLKILEFGPSFERPEANH